MICIEKQRSHTTSNTYNYTEKHRDNVMKVGGDVGKFDEYYLLGSYWIINWDGEPFKYVVDPSNKENWVNYNPTGGYLERAAREPWSGLSELQICHHGINARCMGENETWPIIDEIDHSTISYSTNQEITQNRTRFLSSWPIIKANWKIHQNLINPWYQIRKWRRWQSTIGYKCCPQTTNTYKLANKIITNEEISNIHGKIESRIIMDTDNPFQGIRYYAGLQLIVNEEGFTHDYMHFQTTVNTTSRAGSTPTIIGITKYSLYRAHLSLEKLLYLHFSECLGCDFCCIGHVNIHTTLLPHEGIFVCIFPVNTIENRMTAGLLFKRIEGELILTIDGAEKGIIFKGLETWSGKFKPFVAIKQKNKTLEEPVIRRRSEISPLMAQCRKVIQKSIKTNKQESGTKTLHLEAQKALVEFLEKEDKTAIKVKHLPIPQALKNYIL